MIRDDKERVIGKLININSEKFTVELLNQSINFTVSGFDDIYQYAQINGYVILPYQDYYIVAEIFGVREKDADIKWKGEKEQILSKSNSVKYLDITPIGSIQKKKFKYGISVFPTLYSDVLYIKKEELDTIFEHNIEDEDKSIEIDEVTGTRLHLLDIGTSTIFPDYKVKININGFFGAHSAVLGNTGSGKSCTISSMVQNLFQKKEFSASGATFIFFDVNGEYHKAFSQISNKDIEVRYFSLNEKKEKDNFSNSYHEADSTPIIVGDNIEYFQFHLPHWFLNIDEWALLLKASEKTQLPILRNALGLAAMFSSSGDIKHLKNHILATCITQILRDESGSPSKKDRIISILQKFNTTEISLATSFTYTDKEGATHTTVTIDIVRGVPQTLPCNIRNCLTVHFGDMKGLDHLLFFFEQKNDDGTFKFLSDTFKMPTYESSQKFDFNRLEDALDIAILYEEAHGNRQIRDYCSSLFTRFKSLKERGDFKFMTQEASGIDQKGFIDNLLGLETNGNKKTEISIIDLNSVEDEIVEIISCVSTRLFFEKLKKHEPRNTYPVNLVLEEAHRYISNDKGKVFSDAIQIFERVAKEGRKYGLFLLISSQRPSELSRTVLSQCSNFIIHRIQNPEDLMHIRQMTPHISTNILNTLPSIPRQHALVFGHSVQIPTLFKVNNASPTPHSSDNDITKNWFKPKPVLSTQSHEEDEFPRSTSEEDFKDLL